MPPSGILCDGRAERARQSVSEDAERALAREDVFIPATDVLALGADRLMQDVTISIGGETPPSGMSGEQVPTLRNFVLPAKK